MRHYTLLHARLDRFKLKLKNPLHRVPSTAPILFVTGASANHFKTLLQFLCNFSGLRKKNPQFNLVIWDLGLTTFQLEFLKNEFPNFYYDQFDFAIYPDWFNIKIEGGYYAWKPQIIASSMKRALAIEAHFLCWADAGNLFHEKNLGPLIHYMDRYGIYSPDSSGTIEKWIHPKMLEFLEVSSWPFSVHTLPMRNASFLGFNLQDGSVRTFINQFREKASIKDCIAPEGSNKYNHRQDQALFTLLYYQYVHRLKYPYNNQYFGFSVQNDIDH